MQASGFRRLFVPLKIIFGYLASTLNFTMCFKLSMSFLVLDHPLASGHDLFVYAHRHACKYNPAATTYNKTWVRFWGQLERHEKGIR